MRRNSTRLSRRYATALRTHLKQGARASLQPAGGLGRQALAIGLESLDLARIHKHAVVAVVGPHYSAGSRDGMIKRAETFFVEAIRPIEQTYRAVRETNVHLSQVNKTLHQRTVELAAANRQLKQQIIQRKTAEVALKKSQQHYSQLLEQSRRMQEQLRHLSHQLLIAQEEERKEISRELHDEIAQT